MLVVFGHIVRFDVPQETNIIIGMEFGHLVLSGFVRTLFNKIIQNIISGIIFTFLSYIE